MTPSGSKMQWAGVFLTAFLGLLGLVAASSCAGVGDDCQFDSDCGGANLCIEQTCHSSCTDVEDCEVPYDMCEPYTRERPDGEETVRVCVTDPFESPNNSPDGGACSGADCCQSDADCVQAFDNERARCGIDQRCYIPVAHGVLLSDRTEVDTAKDPEDGGLGADIAAVFVRSSAAGEPVGYGSTLDYSPANGVQGPASTFAGSAPQLDASGECVAGTFEDSAVALGGQGGHLLIEFVDADGKPLQLNDSWQVVVVEWGENCGSTADSQDIYDVSFCSGGARSGDIDPSSDCSRLLNEEGPVSGFQALTVRQ